MLNPMIPCGLIALTITLFISHLDGVWNMTHLILRIRIRLFGSTTHILHNRPLPNHCQTIIHTHIRLIQFPDGCCNALCEAYYTRNRFLVCKPIFHIRKFNSRAAARTWAHHAHA